MGRVKYAIKVPIDDGWLYVTETDTNGDLVARTFDTREEAEALKKSIDYLGTDALSQVVEYHKDPFGNRILKLTQEEIEELREKKQTIKEELYEKVKMEMFKASSDLEGMDYGESDITAERFKEISIAFEELREIEEKQRKKKKYKW